MIILASMIDEPGDLVKFQTLYSLYSGAMYTTAFNILENADDAEDAVQISSLKIIKNLNRLEMEEIHDIKTKSFLLTIARNTALDIWRKRKKEPVSVEEVEMDGLAPSAEKIYFDKVSVNNLAEVVEEDNFFKIRYVNDNGQWYYFACYEYSHSANVDTENAVKKEIETGENNITVYVKEGNIQAIMYQNFKQFVISGEIDLDEIQKIFESIK